jgi:hypothetical protein
MMAKFKSSYKDKHDGTKMKLTTIVSIVDLRADLGHKFLFIDCKTVDGTRSIRQEICLPVKDIKRLISALKKVAK